MEGVRVFNRLLLLTDMHKRLERLALRKGKPVTDLVNQLFKRDPDWVEGWL